MRKYYPQKVNKEELLSIVIESSGLTDLVRTSN